MRRLPAAPLLLLLSATLTVHSQGLPQSCAEALRTASTPRSAAASISARQLTIPVKAWDHYHRAAAAFGAGNAALGEAEAATALTLAPRFAEVELLRAVAALASGRSDESLDHLAAARALDPALPWLGIGAAGALNNLRRYDAALAALDTIPGIEAVGWESAYEHARASVGLRDLPAALTWSERAISLAPAGCTDARLVHANALGLNDRTAEAARELETYLAEDRRGVPHPKVVAALAKARASLRADATPSASPIPRLVALK